MKSFCGVVVVSKGIFNAGSVEKEVERDHH